MQHFFIFQPSHCPFFFPPFLRQMLCEKHDVAAGPGSEMWIPLTMQFKEIHINKGGAETSTWDILVISPCQNRLQKAQCNIYIFQSSVYLFPLFIYLSIFEFIFLLKREKQRSCKLLTSFQILNILTNSSYFLRALFSKWIIYRSYNSFVMHQCFKPAVGLLRHWCRKRACSAKSFGISCFVSGCLISSSVSLRLQLKKSGASIMSYVIFVNVCYPNNTPVLHHTPVPTFRFVRSVQAPLQVKPALPVVQLNLVVQCPVVSWMPSAVFCLDVTIFIFLSVKKGLAHHYRNRGHEPRADLVTGERQET